MTKWRALFGAGKQQHQQPADDDGAAAVASGDAENDKAASSQCYDLPCGMSFILRATVFKFVPFCPTFLVDVKQQPSRDDVEANGGGSQAREIPPETVESGM